MSASQRCFEVSRAALEKDISSFIDRVYADLTSSFTVMPMGEGFVHYPRFQNAYEILKRETSAFRKFTPDTIWKALIQDGLVLLVLRTILGMSPPEWADLADRDLDAGIGQGAARAIDKNIRLKPDYIARLNKNGSDLTTKRIKALVQIACTYITKGAPPETPNTVHRLRKVDTTDGLASLQTACDIHVPYAVLLYERYLGRPFASHRDTVSELIGDVMESAVEASLQGSKITYRKTKRAERINGFDQAPDFIIPDELAPSVVIEAKITNDDGTARDKFTRLIHLKELSNQWEAAGKKGFQVVACIDGRGFGIRREDMRRLLLALDGKVFTLNTLDHLVSCTTLSKFACK